MPRLPDRLRGLRVQILLWTIVPATVLAFGFLLSGVREHQQSMRAMVAEHDLELVQALAGRVGAHLELYQIAVASVPRAAAQTDVMGLETWFVTVQEDLPGLSLAAVSAEGEVVAGPGEAAGWLLEPLGDVDQATLSPDGEAVVWAVEHGPNLAVLGRLPLDAIPWQRLLNVSELSSGLSLVLTDGHTVLFGSGDVPTGGPVDRIPGVAEALALQTGVLFSSEPSGDLVVAFAPVPELEWALVLQEPWLPLVAPLLRLDRVMAFVLIMAGATSLLTLFFGVRYVVLPLRALAIRAKEIGEGQFSAASEPVGGVEEIEDLRRTLDEMAGQLGHYQTALEGQLTAQVRAQEDERARLARELHDETVQSLIALNQQVQMAQRTLENDPASTKDRLGALRQMTAAMIMEVRRFSQALRPLYLEDLGPAPALELLVKDYEAEFRLEGQPRRLGQERELAVYRVAQEALNNARRHSGATHIQVDLSFGGSGLCLVVHDNGVGLGVPTDPRQLGRSGHFGLLSMQERAQLVGGRLEIASAPGAGTTVRMCVPYEGQ